MKDQNSYFYLQHMEIHREMADLIPWLTGDDYKPLSDEPNFAQSISEDKAKVAKCAREFIMAWERLHKKELTLPSNTGTLPTTKQAVFIDSMALAALDLIFACDSYNLSCSLDSDMMFLKMLKERQEICDKIYAKAKELEHAKGNTRELDDIFKLLDEMGKKNAECFQQAIKERQSLANLIKGNKTLPKRPKLTQAEAASCCGVTEKTIRNWDSGATKAPDWYPGRDVTAVEMKMRAQHGRLQDRMAKAVRKEIENARKYREEED
ncbi:hypothetical protein [uncultured Victivallis sp.]|uniref:hypothetical protein n=1 Tax=uncultured Victivallis sp. TaxID=354118 RepID=UPI0025F8BB7A|nr:hypothetical protein [uncultured Victivallis sp.]